MEAMSRGLPSIIVNTGGPKVNTTNETSIKIEPAPMEKMIEEISKAIIDLGLNKKKREEMGKAAREYALNTFLLNKRTLKMCDYYKRVTAVGDKL